MATQLFQTTQALRPNFTASLIKGMDDNQHSYHIVAADADGPDRLLLDIKNALPGHKTVVVNTHDFESA